MRLHFLLLLLSPWLLLSIPGYADDAIPLITLATAGEQISYPAPELYPAPEQVERRVRLDGRIYSLTLVKHSMRSTSFNVVQLDGLDSAHPLGPIESRVYRGHIDSLPNAHVSAYIDTSGNLHGAVQMDDTPGWTFQGDLTTPVSTPMEATVATTEPVSCTLADSPQEPMLSSRPNHLLPPARLYVPSADTGFHHYGMKLSVFIPWQVIQRQSDGQLVDAVAAVEFQLDQLGMQMNRLGLVQLNLDDVVIGSPGSDTDDREHALKQFWQLKDRGMLHGLPLLVTSLKDNSFSFVRGLEQRPGMFWTLCSTSELLPFTSRFEHPMNFNQGDVSRQSRSILRWAERDLSRNGRVDPPKWPLAPVAQPDQILVRRNDSGRLDPLANDLDANGDPLTLLDFDSQSLAGGQVRQDPDSGELVYRAPRGYVGSDSFYYRISDGTGRTSEAEIAVTVAPNDLAGYWSFDNREAPLQDETRNGVLLSSAAEAIDGVTPAGRALVSGAYLAEPDAQFDPVDGSFTVSFWFRHDGTDQFSLLASKGTYGDSNAVENDGWTIASQGDWLSLKIAYADHDLFAMDWGDPRSEIAQYVPMVRDGRWHHLVMVIDREQQRLGGWIDNQPFTDSAQLPARGGKIHSREPLYFGQRLPKQCNADSGCRSIPNAGIDEVRLYHRALTPAEIELLFLQGVSR